MSMFNDPRVRLAFQSVLAGLLAFLLALQQQNIDDMSANDWVQLVVGAFIAALLYGGVSYGTPINKAVGVGSPNS